MFFEEHLNDTLIDDDIDLSGPQNGVATGASATRVDGTVPGLSLGPRLSTSQTPGLTSSSGGGASASALLHLLMEATENERHCPDILPYPTSVVDSVVAQMAHRLEEVQRLSSEERQQAAESASGTSLLPFKPSDIMTLELQRVQFFLCEFLRCRLRKIEALCVSIYYEGLLESGEYTPEEMAMVRQPQRANLSPNERVVADRLAHATQQAVLESGLKAVPGDLQRLVPHLPHGEGAEILPVPDASTYVFGVALEELGIVQLGEGAEQAIHAGEVFLMPYRTFRPYVVVGQVRLV